jgi:hypothetical protein
MNGTSRQELLALRKTTYRAVHAAVLAVQQMAPNGRDYYPDPGRFERAQAQHQRRLAILRALLEECVLEADMLQKP